MSSSDDKLLLYSTLGFCAGVFWFIKGFRVYREYRVVADTPESPIRSIPMGFVEIHGKAKPATDKFVPSPVSQTPCLFYKVDIERWIKDKDGGHWAFFATDADGPPFYLEDTTGKVLVDARGAEYDLLQSGRCEAGSSGLTSVFLASGGRASPGDVSAYVSRVAMRHHGSLIESIEHLSVAGAFGQSSGRFRLTEYCILPEHWYDLTGTCVENPNPKDEHDRNMIVKGQNEPTFLISWRNKQAEEGLLRWRALKYIFGGGALSFVCLAVILLKLGWF